MSGWISVDDRLPMEIDQSVPYECKRVLATDGEWVGEYGFCRGDGGAPGRAWAEWEDYVWPPSHELTHWMPLPEPPK